MKKTLILIFVVLTALLVSSVIIAQETEVSSTPTEGVELTVASEGTDELTEPETQEQLAEPEIEVQPTESEKQEQPSESEAQEQPTEPEVQEQPSEPEAQEQPAVTETQEQPTEPEAQEQPTEPETQEQPTEPEVQEQPTEPETQEQPTEPETQEQPTEPETQEQPTEPEAQEQLTEPETQEQPTEPETQEQPTEPEAQEQPAVTETQEQPIVTETQEQPTEPETQEQPAVTETQEQPAVTETQEQPTVTETPEQPIVTETPEQPTEPETQEQPTEEVSVKIIIAVTGSQKSDVYDGELHTAEGYYAELVSCEGTESCPYTKDDIEFKGEAKAERSELGKTDMGLNADMFSYKNEDVDVEFRVVDGYQEIVPETTDEMVVIDQTGSDEEPGEEGAGDEGSSDETGNGEEEIAEITPEFHEGDIETPILVIHMTPEEQPEDVNEPVEGEQSEEVTEEPVDGEQTEEEATEEPVEGELTEEATEEPVEGEQTEEATEEPVEGEQTEEATEEPVEGELTEEVTEEPVEGELTEEATEEPVEGEQTEEATEEPVEGEQTEEATEEPVEGEQTEEATEEPVEGEQTEEATEEPVEGEQTEEATEEPVEGEQTEEDEDGFKVIISGTATPAAETEPTDATTETPAIVETPSPETETEAEVKTLTLNSESMVFTGADEESEVLLTTEDNIEVTILSVDEETGWALVELPDGTTGYVMMPAEEEEEEEIPATVTPEAEEADKTVKSLPLTEETVIYAAADAEGEVVEIAFEEGMELTILSVDEETGWALVELPDGTTGYVKMPVEEGEEAPEAEDAEKTVKSLPLTEETVIYAAADAEGEVVEIAFEEGLELKILSIDEETGWALVELPDGTTGYVMMADEEEEEEPFIVKAASPVRVSADGMSMVIFTFDEDTEVTVLEIEGDWIKVELSDGKIGYIFKGDFIKDKKSDKDVVEKKVTIFTTIHPMMKVNEPITLTSYLEGFEDCVEITYQWECDKGDGFEPVEGATGNSYTYEATVESVAWSWQLVVKYR